MRRGDIGELTPPPLRRGPGVAARTPQPRGEAQRGYDDAGPDAVVVVATPGGGPTPTPVPLAHQVFGLPTQRTPGQAVDPRMAQRLMGAYRMRYQSQAGGVQSAPAVQAKMPNPNPLPPAWAARLK
jgi:hypothetical protein